jgi:hypothetical protein
MRRYNSWLAISTLAIGGAFVTQIRAVDPVPPSDSGRVGTTPDAAIRTDANGATIRTDTKTTEIRTGDRGNAPAVAAPDADDIRKTLAWVTETAVTKGDFDKLQKRFIDADADRLKKFKSADNFAQLDGRIEQFQKDWKAKYNEDFKFERTRGDVLNDQFAKIVQGEIGEARTASNKEMPSAEPQNVKGGTPDQLKKSGVNQPDANSDKTFGGKTNREPGRNIATVIIPAGASMSIAVKPDQSPAISAKTDANKDLAVPLIHELPDTWKIDVPDNIDGQRLYDNMLKHLTMVDEDRANWPADKNEAYRTVTRHVLCAVMDSGEK